MFRFSIRELMLVTLVVAVAVGWGVDHCQQSTREESLVRAKTISDDRFDFLQNVMTLEGFKINDERDENGILRLTAKPPGFLPTSSAPPRIRPSLEPSGPD